MSDLLFSIYTVRHTLQAITRNMQIGSLIVNMVFRDDMGTFSLL